MCTWLHIHTFLHDFPDGFSPDFLDLTIFQLISFNALFHDVFHEGTDGEAFLSGDALNLVNEFLEQIKEKCRQGSSLGESLSV